MKIIIITNKKKDSLENVVSDGLDLLENMSSNINTPSRNLSVASKTY
jgi:hypothetical protein